MLGASIRNNMIGLSIFAVFTAGIIAYTQATTEVRIARNVEAAKSKALYQILPPETHDNVLLETVIPVSAPDLIQDEGQGEAFIAIKQGKPIAVILPAIAPDGYTGKIRSIVGINEDGSITGVRVLTHQETPGLGDKIEIKKSDWIRQFEGKSLTNLAPAQWQVQKDGGVFDQLTGATITPRAIVNSVYKALAYFETHKDELLIIPADQQE